MGRGCTTPVTEHMAGPRISLEELKNEFNLSQDQLDAKVNLKEASIIIADPEILGEELGLSQTEMTAIRRLERLELQMSAVLRTWKQVFVWKATYRVLLEALLKIGRADCATDMCESLTKSKYEHRTVSRHTATTLFLYH